MLMLFQEDSGLAEWLGSAVLFVIIFVAIGKIPFIDKFMGGTVEEPYIGLKYVGTFALVIAMMLIAGVLSMLILGQPLY